MTSRQRPSPRYPGPAGLSLPARLAAGLALLLFRLSPPALAAPLRQSYDLPAGDASRTLELFSQQSGEQILFPVQEVRGVETRAVKGSFTPREALERMVAGTRLAVVEDRGTGALAVRSAPTRSRGPPETRVAAQPAEPTAAGARPPSPRPPPAPWRPAADETIELPPFVITSERDASYLGKESLGTTRAGVPLADLAQSVVVLNRSFIDDLNPDALGKSLLYVGGGQTGTISWSVDRDMIRGFVGEGDYVDGFRTLTDRNSDLNLIDHVEVIKGPSAIFIGNMANTVGGVVSKVSKNPTDYPEASLTAQVGAWNSDRADLDVGGPIGAGRRLAYRLLLAGQDSPGYYDHTYEKRTAILPMLSLKLGETGLAWIKFEKFDSHYSSYNGVPLDGQTANGLPIGQGGVPIPGVTNRPLAVPARTNLNENSPYNWRTDWFWRVWSQASFPIGDHLAVRLALFDSADWQRRVESVPAPTGGTVATVNGVPVLTPQYVIPPNFVPGGSIPRSTTAVNPDYQPRREAQNDYVVSFSTGAVSHKLLLGGDAIDYPERTSNWSGGAGSTASSSPINPLAPSFPGAVSVDFSQPPASYTATDQTFTKLYGLETASLAGGRVILSWGASRNRFETARTTRTYSQLTGQTSTTGIPDQVLTKNLVQTGVLVKPLPGLSVFYGENRNFASNGFSPSGALQPPQQGRQREIGLKSRWLDGRLTANLSYFDIVQLNNAVVSYPQTVPLSNVLVNGTISRGFDGDFGAELGAWDFIGSFAWFKAHVPLPAPWNLVAQPYDGRVYRDLPVDNASERNAALWARRKFSGRWQNLAAGVGVNSLARRAVTDNNNQEFYGYVPGRILVDAMARYDAGRMRWQLNVDNLFDRRYVWAARSNQVILPGPPVNFRLSATYRFQ